MQRIVSSFCGRASSVSSRDFASTAASLFQHPPAAAEGPSPRRDPRQKSVPVPQRRGAEAALLPRVPGLHAHRGGPEERYPLGPLGAPCGCPADGSQAVLHRLFTLFPSLWLGSWLFLLGFLGRDTQVPGSLWTHPGPVEAQHGLGCWLPTGLFRRVHALSSHHQFCEFH